METRSNKSLSIKSSYLNRKRSSPEKESINISSINKSSKKNGFLRAGGILYLLDKSIFFKKENKESVKNNLLYGCFIQKDENEEIYFYKYAKYNIDDIDNKLFCFKCCDEKCNGIINVNYSKNIENLKIIYPHNISNKKHSYILYPTYGYQIYIDLFKQNKNLNYLQLVNNIINNKNFYKDINILNETLKNNDIYNSEKDTINISSNIDLDDNNDSNSHENDLNNNNTTTENKSNFEEKNDKSVNSNNVKNVRKARLNNRKKRKKSRKKIKIKRKYKKRMIKKIAVNINNKRKINNGKDKNKDSDNNNINNEEEEIKIENTEEDEQEGKQNSEDEENSVENSISDNNNDENNTNINNQLNKSDQSIKNINIDLINNKIQKINNKNNNNKNNDNSTNNNTKIYAFFRSRKNQNLSYGKEVYYHKLRKTEKIKPDREKWNDYIEHKFGENVSIGTLIIFNRKLKTFYRYRPLFVTNSDTRQLKYCCLESGCEGRILFDLRREIIEETAKHSLGEKSHIFSTHPKNYELQKYFEENQYVNFICVLREYKGE